MQYPIVLANAFYRSAMVAISNPNKRAKYPYAISYWQSMYQTRKPEAHCLSTYGRQYMGGGNRYSCSRDDVDRALDIFLKSYGKECPWPLPSDLVNLLLPFKAHRERQRQDHRICVEVTVKEKIAARKHQARLAQVKDEILTLSYSAGDFSTWVTDHVHEFTQFELITFIRHYYEAQRVTDWKFHELFYDTESEPSWLASSVECELCRALENK